MSEPLTPFRFEPPVDDGTTWDADGDPDRRRQLLAESFDRLARGQADEAPPGIATLAAGDPAARAQELGYRAADLARVPAPARLMPLGLGGLIEHAVLRPGHAVLDLGCGAGLDAQLAAWRVAPGGSVVGIDLSEGMIARAREAGRAKGQAPMTFHTAMAEALPLEDAGFDRVLANCVLSLVPERARALAEIGRVLRPGGRVVIADAASQGLDAGMRSALSGWGNALGGAPAIGGWRRELAEAGLEVLEEHLFPLSRETLLRWAERAAGVDGATPDRRRELRARLRPWIDRLDGRLSTFCWIGRVP